MWKTLGNRWGTRLSRTPSFRGGRGPIVTGLAMRSNFLYGNWAIAQIANSADDRLALGRSTIMPKKSGMNKKASLSKRIVVCKG